MNRVTISPAGAAFLGFVVGALVHAPDVVVAARAASASTFVSLAVDALHFLCAGALAAGVVGLFLPWSRGRLVVDASALFLLAVVVGWFVLESDFHNFGVRQSDKLAPWLTRLLLTCATSTTIPLSLVAGRLVRKFRYGNVLGLFVAVLGFAVNERILPRDYSGIHVTIGWVSATLAGASLSGTSAPLPFRLPSLSARAAAVLPLAAGLAGIAIFARFRPPARVQSALAALDASALVAHTGHLHVRLRSRMDKPVIHDRWLERRPVVTARALPEPDKARHFSVIFVTVDALRADVIDSGKYDQRLPNFAKLRKQSLVFTQARATGTATRPSFASMYMGTYTFQQFWIERRGIFGAMPSQDDSVRFAELLTEARVRTTNVASMRALVGRRGFVRGFRRDIEVKAEGSNYAPAAKVMDEIVAALSAKRPFFIFSHLGDPHEPYDLAGTEGTPFERYLREVALVDKALGRLLEALRDDRFDTRTVLIVSADHGEAFGEHDSSSHGTTLYDETLRVPLLIYSPDHEPRVIDDLVSLIDIGPTILELFDVPTPAHFMGQSLAPYLRGETPTLTRPIIAEARSLLAHVTPSRLKVIVDTDTGRTELYDLRKDPLELDNIADDTARLERPLAYLEAFFETHRLRRDGYTPPPIR